MQHTVNNKNTPYPSHFSYLNNSGYVFHMVNNMPVSKIRTVQLFPNAGGFLSLNIFSLFFSNLAFVISESETQHSYMLRHHSEMTLPFSVELLQV